MELKIKVCFKRGKRMKKTKMVLPILAMILMTACSQKTITQPLETSQAVSATSSVQMYENEFSKLENYDIDEAQKLAMILAAEYVDIQQRIDLDALCALNPQIEENISNDRQAIIEQFLLTDNFQLYEVDSAKLEGNTLKFNAVYTFTIDDTSGNSQSVLYTKFVYQYVNDRWQLMETGEDADPSISGKPNRILILMGKQEKTKEQFGVDNIVDLFEFDKINYREEYLNQ